ncbi:MAG: MotA/TolQ/ExbB proton channel family protein [Rugosibacter sp.]|nr:MAG: MotA/TolQ/ExbB proton channel family protein [Rugosibacter sp.]
MENSLGFAHFLVNSDGIARFILVLMALMSMGTWYLIVTKGVRLIITQRKSNAFLKSFWKTDSLATIAHQLRQTGVTEPFSHLVHHAFTAIEQHKGARDGQKTRGLIDAGTPDEFLTRSLKRGIAQNKANMEYGQTFIATVASSAPFVGLFGTVWGIYHALLTIGISGQGTLDKVAGPVGEALIMTAIGLAVAIPAAVAYNAFARANRNTLAELNSFAHDLFTFLVTGLKTTPHSGDVATMSERIIARVVANTDATHTHAAA